MGIHMLVTITIPETEERSVALVQDLVTLLQKYPGVFDGAAEPDGSVQAKGY